MDGTLTRIRTWNIVLEAQGDFHFTIRARLSRSLTQPLRSHLLINQITFLDQRDQSDQRADGAIRPSTLTRIRTWNTAFEAQHDIRFTIRAFHSLVA